MKEVGCYTDDQRGEVDNNETWACPACADLDDEGKQRREAESFHAELVRVTWEPSWEPEDTKEKWPTFQVCIQEFEARQNEPDLSVPPAAIV